MDNLRFFNKFLASDICQSNIIYTHIYNTGI